MESNALRIHLFWNQIKKSFEKQITTFNLDFWTIILILLFSHFDRCDLWPSSRAPWPTFGTLTEFWNWTVLKTLFITSRAIKCCSGLYKTNRRNEVALAHTCYSLVYWAPFDYYIPLPIPGNAKLILLYKKNTPKHIDIGFLGQCDL